MRERLLSFGGFFSWNQPAAGAFCFVKYNSDIPNLDICQNMLENQSTLIVPGSHLGMEGLLRIWFGARPDFLREGLRRIGAEIQKLIN